ncbi:Alpha/beta hydrolase2 [Operophtera brumata]|uniref:Alpha/beta hydrolase2 n=1 Tax=Operophtera brumata TaxID=104452 RepID=A0A0L7L4V6_OPEBR|nr:Alpha/beta hydrolase2 [Operophtera brumata]
MAASRVFEPHQPSYGATFGLELRQDIKSGKYSIMDKTDSPDLTPLGPRGVRPGGLVYANPVNWLDRALVGIAGGLLMAHDKCSYKDKSVDTEYIGSDDEPDLIRYIIFPQKRRKRSVFAKVCTHTERKSYFHVYAYSVCMCAAPPRAPGKAPFESPPAPHTWRALGALLHVTVCTHTERESYFHVYARGVCVCAAPPRAPGKAPFESPPAPHAWRALGALLHVTVRTHTERESYFHVYARGVCVCAAPPRAPGKAPFESPLAPHAWRALGALLLVTVCTHTERESYFHMYACGVCCRLRPLGGTPPPAALCGNERGFAYDPTVPQESQNTPQRATVVPGETECPIVVRQGRQSSGSHGPRLVSWEWAIW